jgi:hypothetical protein
MAYSTFPQSTHPLTPRSPSGGALPRRFEPATRSGAARNPDASESTAATTDVLRFLILLAILCGLACLYVWQANTISALREVTQTIRAEVKVIERQNVSLMLEYAQYDRPARIEAQSSQAGMVAGQTPVRVQLSGLTAYQAATSPETKYASSVWGLATTLPGSPIVWSQSE